MENQITDTVTNLFSGTDARNWAKVKSVMAAQIKLDFSSLSGDAAGTMQADEIVSRWKAVLPGFDCTHHQVSGFHVVQYDDIAVVHYIGRADHFIENKVWTVEGTYDTELIYIDNNWLINKHKFNLIKQSGDATLLLKAAEIVKHKVFEG